MALTEIVERIARNLRRRGLAGTLGRAAVQAWRAAFPTRFIVFAASPGEVPPPSLASAGLSLERREGAASLTGREIEALAAARGPRTAAIHAEKRFAAGSTLWLLERGGEPLGMVWTLRGRTLHPYYFPLRADDWHLYDNEVFEQHRGKGLNTLLLGSVLSRAAAEGATRALIETASWNRRELGSLRKTPFTPLGSARAVRLPGRTLLLWKDA